MNRAVRLAPGDKPAEGVAVTLYQGFGDARRIAEWFTTDGTWICPETLNGFWYGCEAGERVR